MKLIFSTAIFFALSLSSTGCFQTYNSSTTDPDRYGGGVASDGTPGSERFVAAYNLLRDRCFACHSHTFNAFKAQDEFLNGSSEGRSLVVAGNPSNSAIYMSLKGTGLTQGRQDMPQDSTLSGSELATIRDWIQLIGQ